MSNKKDIAFNNKLLDMELPHRDLVSKEDEEMAWKVILQEIDKNGPNRSRKWWLVAASLIVALGLAYLFLPADNTVYTTGTDEKLNIVLTDGSEVTLNHSSQLRIDASFGNKSRKVSLTGEAFFNVQKNSLVPFVIQMNDIQVKVLGTSFSVKQKGGNTIVAVRTGKVSLICKQGSMFLESGQKGLINKMGELIEQTWEPNDLAWYNGTLIFDEMPLSEVVKVLSEYTKKPVAIESGLSSCMITAKIEFERIEEVLDIIAETLDINWKEEPKRILFYGKGC